MKTTLSKCSKSKVSSSRTKKTWRNKSHTRINLELWLFIVRTLSMSSISKTSSDFCYTRQFIHPTGITVSCSWFSWVVWSLHSILTLGNFQIPILLLFTRILQIIVSTISSSSKCLQNWLLLELLWTKDLTWETVGISSISSLLCHPSLICFSRPINFPSLGSWEH